MTEATPWKESCRTSPELQRRQTYSPKNNKQVMDYCEQFVFLFFNLLHCLIVLNVCQVKIKLLIASTKLASSLLHLWMVTETCRIQGPKTETKTVTAPQSLHWHSHNQPADGPVD